MKIFIPLLCLLSLAKAEPPVGEGYPAARSSHDHHDRDHHDNSDLTRSLSQEYGTTRTFGSSRNSLTTEYGPPNTRSSHSSEYGPPSRTASSRKYAPPAARTSFSQTFGPSKSQGKGIAQEYATPNARTELSQEYGAPNVRNVPSQEYVIPERSRHSQKYRTPNARNGLSQEYGAPSARSGLSQEYGAPNARNGLSQEYGAPSARSGLSQEYGAPEAHHGLSQEYGAPNARDRLSKEYGAPAQRSLSHEYGAPELTSRSLSTEYGVPDARSTPSEEYGAPAVARSGKKTRPKSFNLSSSKGFHKSHQSSARSFQPKSRYSAPRSNDFSHSAPKTKRPFGSQSQSSAVPQSYTRSSSLTRDSDSYSQEYSPSETYGAPAKELSDTYGVPSSRALSQEYGAPSTRANLKTNAIVSSYSSASSRSSPSSTYVPSAHDSMPSEEYGVPEQYDAPSNQGYNYDKDALDDSLNQEPANYDFAYKVNDFESGSDFGHTESRQENHAEGSYFVVLPDGTKQTVEYEADEGGFKPRISVEPLDASARSGYDENASDLAKSDGPY